ncbi:MAG: EAL domain-containing protein [Acidobacteria bacterium]|nr:EAL domain-containing protein [Acidobacteriota bacterium]
MRAFWASPYDRSHPEAPRFRSLQVQSVVSLTPWVLLANWANVAALGWIFRDTPQTWPLVVWMSATAVVAAIGLPAWRRLRSGFWPKRTSESTVHRVATHAGLLALMWAMPMVFGYAGGEGIQRVVVLGVAVGMLCVGGFALAPVPRAASRYVMILAAGILVGLIRDTDPGRIVLLLLCPIYAGIVLGTVSISAQQMGGRLVAEADSARQKRVVDLLLDDFHENSPDWLWELDRDGRLQYSSPRLSAALGVPQEQLDGTALTAHLRERMDPDDPVSAAAVDALERALEAGHAVRAAQVPIVAEGRRQWWSISGKRVFDEDGAPMGWRGVGSDVTGSREHSAALARLANFDTLTQLANRHQFQVRMNASSHLPCTLLYLDLDDFKAVNDLHGHLVGDEVLKVVARRFRAVLRQEDLLARLGGDEFAVVLWDTTDRCKAAATAQRLIATLDEPVTLDDLALRVGTCIGIVGSDHAEASYEGLTRLADMALYAAKARGRNTYMFFESSMESAARRRLSLMTDLHASLANDRLELHYQPLVSLGSGQVVGAEALLRWRHPTRGLIAPAEFVPLAEETGLIVAIGQWALRQACEVALTWPSHMRVAVNLSPLQFASRSLVLDVKKVLEQTRLEPRRLELEITESSLTGDSVSVGESLRTLRELGVRVALDDFGTGYSSLAYLRTYPLDALKIDGAFVRTLNGEQDATEVIRAIVQVAGALRMDVTAEGVETLAQFELLRSLGCTDAQGYWLGKPMTHARLASHLARTSADVRIA